jgi:hypothetical protein
LAGKISANPSAAPTGGQLEKSIYLQPASIYNFIGNGF